MPDSLQYVILYGRLDTVHYPLWPTKCIHYPLWPTNSLFIALWPTKYVLNYSAKTDLLMSINRWISVHTKVSFQENVGDHYLKHFSFHLVATHDQFQKFLNFGREKLHYLLRELGTKGLWEPGTKGLTSWRGMSYEGGGVPPRKFTAPNIKKHSSIRKSLNRLQNW